MNLLLISVNREKFPAPVPPLGIAYLMRALALGGHTAKLLDLCFEDKPIGRVKREIRAVAPDVLLISIRNIDNQTLFQPVTFLDYMKRVMDACRSVFKGKIIIGGAAVSIMPKEFFEFLKPDVAVAGEAEDIINGLLDHREDKVYLANKEYLVTRGDDPGKVYLPHRSRKGFLVSIPWRNFYDPRYYTYEAAGLIPGESIQTRRGCAFSCSYCKCPDIEGNSLRLRRIDFVMEEMQIIISRGSRNVFFVDSNFNYPKDYARELCLAMIHNKLNIQWMCYLYPTHIDKELAALMKKAGCTSVYFGTDHLEDTMLQNLHKGFTVADVLEADRVCAQAGIKTVHAFLFGGIGENNRTIDECLGNIDRLMSKVIFFSLGIRLYPGTSLYFEAVKSGEIAGDVSLLKPTFYLSPLIEIEQAAGSINDFIKRNRQKKLVKCTFPLENVVGKPQTNMDAPPC
ncbi:MAG TPA: radical SAM protein [Candidatus Deferrimicrobium sp.]|nr:radical SAM protein [Candidatus Deferrimicrobium sp.]